MWEDANGARSRVAPPKLGPKDIRITTRTEMMNDDLELVVVKVSLPPSSAPPVL